MTQKDAGHGEWPSLLWDELVKEQKLFTIDEFIAMHGKSLLALSDGFLWNERVPEPPMYIDQTVKLAARYMYEQLFHVGDDADKLISGSEHMAKINAALDVMNGMYIVRFSLSAEKQDLPDFRRTILTHVKDTEHAYRNGGIDSVVPKNNLAHARRVGMRIICIGRCLDFEEVKHNNATYRRFTYEIEDKYGDRYRLTKNDLWSRGSIVVPSSVVFTKDTPRAYIDNKLYFCGLHSGRHTTWLTEDVKKYAYPWFFAENKHW